MNPKNVATSLGNVVFPEGIELTYIDADEASIRPSKVGVQKILQESIKKKLELEPENKM